jgi:hypothetical protein
VSSKCFQLYYTCSDRLLAIALPPYSFHLFSPLTVTFPKLSVILRPLYSLRTALRMFTPRRDQLVICGQYQLSRFFVDGSALTCFSIRLQRPVNKVTAINITHLVTKTLKIT